MEDMLRNRGGVLPAFLRDSSAPITASTPGETTHSGGFVMPRKLITTSAPSMSVSNLSASVTEPSTTVIFSKSSL